MDMRILDDLVARLRGPDGCPWDREQTLTDLRAYLLEEAHEVAAALDAQDWDGLQEEIGDLLFQLAFLGRLSEEAGRFSLSDSIASVRKKMVDRHPHVFGDANVLGDATPKSSKEVAADWERRKLEQRTDSSVLDGASVLDGVNPSLPGLLTSYRMTQKAAGVGFDWDSVDGVFEKVREELAEVESAQAEGAERVLEEIGDLLFAVANLARHLGTDPEAALARSNLEFRRRFQFIEQALAEQGRRVTDASLAEMEALWEEAKKSRR